MLLLMLLLLGDLETGVIIRQHLKWVYWLGNPGLVTDLCLGARLGLTTRFVSVIQEYSIPLILGVVAGLVVANIDGHLYEGLVEYAPFGHDAILFGRHVTAHFLINEVFMAVSYTHLTLPTIYSV